MFALGHPEKIVDFDTVRYETTVKAKAIAAFYSRGEYSLRLLSGDARD
jgi:hypothetical protein